MRGDEVMRVGPSCKGLVPFPPVRRRTRQPTTQKAFIRARPCWNNDLRHPASRIGRNKLLFFTRHPGYGILLERPQKTKTPRDKNKNSILVRHSR